jgi:hypothetical protein
MSELQIPRPLRCARCGVTELDTDVPAWAGFIDGELYCFRCVTPDQVRMLMTFDLPDVPGD